MKYYAQMIISTASYSQYLDQPEEIEKKEFTQKISTSGASSTPQTLATALTLTVSDLSSPTRTGTK